MIHHNDPKLIEESEDKKTFRKCSHYIHAMRAHHKFTQIFKIRGKMERDTPTPPKENTFHNN